MNYLALLWGMMLVGLVYLRHRSKRVGAGAALPNQAAPPDKYRQSTGDPTKSTSQEKPPVKNSRLAG